MITALTLADGERLPIYEYEALYHQIMDPDGPKAPFPKPIKFYHHPCRCNDGDIIWERGKSLTPILAPAL